MKSLQTFPILNASATKLNACKFRGVSFTKEFLSLFTLLILFSVDGLKIKESRQVEVQSICVVKLHILLSKAMYIYTFVPEENHPSRKKL